MVIDKVLPRLKSWSPLIGITAVAFLIAVGILMLLFNLTHYSISLAAIAATIAIIFLYKEDSESTSLKILYGAYVIAAFWGYLAVYLGHAKSWAIAISIILTLVTMISVNLVHAPAIGLTLSLTLNRFSLSTTLAILFCVYALIAIAKATRYVMHHPERFCYPLGRHRIYFKFRREKHDSFIVLNEQLQKFWSWAIK